MLSEVGEERCDDGAVLVQALHVPIEIFLVEGEKRGQFFNFLLRIEARIRQNAERLRFLDRGSLRRFKLAAEAGLDGAAGLFRRFALGFP